MLHSSRMRGFVLVILLHSASAVIHSLKYFSVGLSGLTNFPKFVVVAQLDGVEMFRYDSNTSRPQPTQDWINKVIADDPDHWSEETENLVIQQHHFQKNMDSLSQNFNQSGGVHLLQGIHGCEWDNDTGDVDGLMKYGYDGEDFIAFNLTTKTWVPPKKQALIIKHKQDNNKTGNIELHHFLSEECPRQLRKYLHYGNSSLLTTEVPSVILLQRSPLSPISCMATGFFPDRAVLFWTKDGEELLEGVDIGETLPNHDGTFQTSADLDPPPHEDWHRYQCVFQLSGDKEELVTKLDKAAVRTNSDKGGIIPIVLGVVIPSALLLLGAGLAAFLACKKKKKKEEEELELGQRAAVSREERKQSSSSGTMMKPADSALSISADSQAPPPDSSAPLMKDYESIPDSGTELKTASQSGSSSSTCLE